MTRQRPPELFVTERPVRSDFGRGASRDGSVERKYARRRRFTMGVLVLLLGVGAYFLFGRSPPDPATLPVIHAEGEWKQKPADPGGIDIPHQDVRVYDQLEGKTTAASLGNGETEHLLPPPEVPKEMPKPAEAPARQFAPPAQQPVTETPPAPAAAPAMPVAKAAQPDAILPAPKVKTVATTVAPAPVAAPVSAPVVQAAPVPEPAPELSIDQVIANTKSATAPQPAVAPASNPAPAIPASGRTSIQLASTTDAAGARAMMQDLQKKYATQLGGATLQVNRADLGAKGIFYRIQSQGLTEAEASHICAQIKQSKAGCILVRK